MTAVASEAAVRCPLCGAEHPRTMSTCPACGESSGHDNDVPCGSTPRGLGGWLLLPAVALVVLPFLLGSDIADDLEFLHEIGWRHLEPSAVLLTGVPAACSVAVLICGIVAAMRFFRKQRGTPGAMIVVLAGLVIRRISKSFLVGIFVYGSDKRLFAAILAMIVYVLPDILNATVWIRYFVKSRRVRETFVN